MRLISVFAGSSLLALGFSSVAHGQTVAPETIVSPAPSQQAAQTPAPQSAAKSNSFDNQGVVDRSAPNVSVEDWARLRGQRELPQTARGLGVDRIDGNIGALAAQPGADANAAAKLQDDGAVTTQLLRSSGATAPLPPTSITELARALKNDPDLIYEFVRDNIELYAVYGVSKGWRGALIDRQGSNYDQAELMVNLLRASGYTASYVAGVIQLTPAQVQSFYGIDTSKACATQNLFSSGQIPNNRLINTGDTCDSPFRGVLMNHVWVRVNIGGTNYDFDPSLKPHALKTGIDVKVATGYNAASYLASAKLGATTGANSIAGLNRPNVRANLTTSASNLVTYLRVNKPAADIDDVLGGKTIVPTDACFPAFVLQSCLTRQTQLPYRNTSYGTLLWTGEIPNEYRVLMRVTLQSPGTSVPGIDQLLLADFFYGKRLTITTDASLRPVLAADGVALATGNPIPAGTAGALDFQIVHGAYTYPINDQTFFTKPYFSGETRNLALGVGPSTSALPAIYRAQAAAATAAGQTVGSEPVLGASLAALGGDWLGQTSMSNYIGDRLGKANTLMHHTFGYVTQAEAPFFDIFAGVSVVQEQGDADLSRAVHVAQAIHLSAFEAGVLEQVTNQPALSTVSLVDRAVLTGQTLYKALAANYASEVEPNLVNCGAFTSTFNAYVNGGYNLYLPQNCAITQNSWTGAGYLIISTSGGTVGSFIDGGYAGGYPSVRLLPSDWGVRTRNRQTPWPTRDPKQRGDPVDVASGAFSYGHEDITVGVGGFPMGLGFQKLYNSGSSGNDGPLGQGWTHNFAVTMRPDTAPWQGLGEDSPIDAASTITETMIAIDLLSDATSPVDKVTTVMVGSRWYADQLVNNAVVMAGGLNGQTFVKLPDGTFNPGPASSARLTQAGDGTYVFSNVNKDTYSFDSTGNVVKWASPTGLEVHWGYTAGQLTSVANSLGRALTLTYSGARIASVADGTGRSVGYGYDVTGNLTSFTDTLGNSATFQYDLPGRMARYFLPANPVAAQIVNTYDSLGRISQQIDADSKIWNYYVAGTRSEVVSPMGRRSIDYFSGTGDVLATYQNVDVYSGNRDGLIRVKNQYDGRGRVTRIIDTMNPILEFSYDDITCNGAEKRCTDNIVSRRRRAIHSLSDTPVLADQIQTFTYEPNFNKLATSNDSGSVTFNYSYDTATGNPVSVNSGANAITGAGTPSVTSYGYTSFTGLAGFPAFTLQTTKTDSINATSSVTSNYAYNAANRFVPQATTLDPGGLAITSGYTYDAVGNLASLDGPRSDVADVTGYAYDSERRLVSVTDALGKQSLNAYNPDGDLVRSTAQIGSQWLARCFTVLPSGKTSKVAGESLVADNTSCPVAAAPVAVTDLTYDGEGNLATSTVNRTVAEGGPKVASYLYSPSGPRLSEFNAVGTSLEQKTVGKGTSAIDPPLAPGTETRQSPPNNYGYRGFNYDGHGRLTQFFPLDCTPGFTPDSGCERYSYTSNDILGSITTRDNRTISFGIDSVSKLAASKQVQLAGTKLTYKTTNYAYDALARQTSAAISAGTSVGIVYDKAGRVTSTAASGRTVSYQYDPAGNRTRITWPDTAFFVTYAYDALNRPTLVKEVGVTALATYGYDDLSRVTSIALGNGTSKSMSFDAQGRLGTLTHDLAGTTGDVTRTLAYDQSGAMTSATTSNGAYDWNGHYNVNRNYTNDGLDAYLTTGAKTLTYDQRGNVLGDGTWTFTYDLENELLSAGVKSGTQLAYSYDALNRLASRTLGSGRTAVVTNYLYDGVQLLGEYSSTGALVRRYIPGATLDEPLVIFDGTNAATKTWLYGDERGSITAAANAAGTLLTAYSYGPFGEPNATAGVSLRYTGQMLDGSSGLYYYRARWYSPYMGRFLSPDPIKLEGGTHLYRYVGNDPVNFDDPLGLQKQGPNKVGDDIPCSAISRDDPIVATGGGLSFFEGAGGSVNGGTFISLKTGQTGKFITVGVGVGIDASATAGNSYYNKLSNFEGANVNVNASLPYGAGGSAHLSTNLDPVGVTGSGGPGVGVGSITYSQTNLFGCKAGR